MEHEIISQIIPYLQYLLIFGAVICGIIGTVKWIHRKGVLHGVDTIRGKTIQNDIEDLQKKFKEETDHTNFSHRTMFKKIDENKDAINKVGRDVAKTKGVVEAISNFIIHGKKIKFDNNNS